MKYIITIILLLLSISTFGQDTLKHKKDTLFKEFDLSFSIRNPKEDSCMFDYLISQSTTLKYKKLILFYKVTYERQNDINYFSHQEKLEYRFCQVHNFYDADRGIKFISATAYYQKKGFKIGVSNMYETTKNTFLIYTCYKYKTISSEIYFLDKVNKVIVSFSPILKTYKQLSIGFKGNYIYSNNKSSYNVLLSFMLKSF